MWQYENLKLTGLDRDAVFRPFFDDFLSICPLSKLCFPASGFFSAEICMI
jgi:hypothetical protein